MPEKWKPIWHIDEYDNLRIEADYAQQEKMVMAEMKLTLTDDPDYIAKLVELIQQTNNNGMIIHDPMNDTYTYRGYIMNFNPATSAGFTEEITDEQYRRLKKMVMKDKEEKEDGWLSV